MAKARAFQQRDPGNLLEEHTIGDVQAGIWEYISPIPSERPESHKLRLYDCVEQDWGPMVDKEAAYEKYLYKVFGQCSCCTFCTAAEITPLMAVNTIRSHVEQSLESYQDHRSAELNPDQNGGVMCSGCGNIFAARKGQARKHLERIKAFPDQHRAVDALLIKRFALEPSEPEVLRRESVYQGPGASQVEEAGERPISVDAPHRSRRKRHRSKHGRGPG